MRSRVRALRRIEPDNGDTTRKVHTERSGEGSPQSKDRFLREHFLFIFIKIIIPLIHFFH